MSTERNRLRRAALLGSAATFVVGVTSAAMTGSAIAQDDEQAAMEQMVVTGSRIARPDLQASSPINVVSAADVQLSGSVNIENVLNELPQVAPSLGGTTNNGGTGAATVDLRALNAVSGAQRTLVLVNGRRFLTSDAEGRVDLNTIPASLIERVEVVTGGASAIYGSDAIAGAVNFILTKDFEGVEVGSQYSITDEGDAETKNVNVTVGGNFADGDGNAVVFVDYYDRNALLAGARGFSDTALTDFGTGEFLEVGSSRIPGGQVVQGDLIVPDRSVGTNAGFQPDGTPFAAPDSFNFQPTNFLQTPQERFLIHGQAEYRVNGYLEAYTEATYANNQVDQQLAFDANDIPDGAAPLFVPLDNPLIAANADLVTFLETNFDQGTLGDEDAGDGIATISDFRRRMTENGPRFEEREFDAYRILIGFRGDVPIPVGANWSYDLHYSFSRTNRTSIFDAFTSDLRIQQALFATTDPVTGEPVCVDASGDCAPLSVFGEGQISEAAAAFIAPTAIEFEETEQQILNASLTGDIFELPAGPIGVAFGFEFRDEEAALTPDLFLQTGELGPGNDNDPTEGGFEVREFFGEAVIPIVRDLPFAKSIDLEGAFRVADYDTVGTNVSFKGGGSWEVFEGLRLRGLFQRAIRAPNVDELFQGQSANSESATDLCTSSQVTAENAASFGLSLAQYNQFCIDQGVPDPSVFVADSQIFTVTAGNPDLMEETANTITAGVVITPSQVPGLTVIVDYYRIEVEDAIDDIDADTVQELCFQAFDLNDLFCQAIVRNPINGSISQLNSQRVNLGAELREGFDWQVDYSFQLGDLLPFGEGVSGIDGATIRLFHVGNYTLNNETTPVPGAQPLDCNGIFGGGCTGLGNFAQPKWRLTNNIDYAYGPVSMRNQVRVIGSLDNINLGSEPPGVTLVTPDTGIEVYWDVAFTYDIVDQFQLFFGVNNLLDNDPPILGFDFAGLGGGADSNTDPSLYDVIGRNFFFGGKVRF